VETDERGSKDRKGPTEKLMVGSQHPARLPGFFRYTMDGKLPRSATFTDLPDTLHVHLFAKCRTTQRSERKRADNQITAQLTASEHLMEKVAYHSSSLFFRLLEYFSLASVVHG
jgi:hypothetical protein